MKVLDKPKNISIPLFDVNFIISFIGRNIGTKTVVRSSGEKETFSGECKRKKTDGYAE